MKHFRRVRLWLPLGLKIYSQRLLKTVALPSTRLKGPWKVNSAKSGERGLVCISDTGAAIWMRAGRG